MQVVSAVDFGTSNSAIGVDGGGRSGLCHVEANEATIPSTIFFATEDKGIFYGRKAIGEYIDGTEGRFMRALKSILGTSLMDETTKIGGSRASFRDILTGFVRHLKTRAEEDTGLALDTAVFGRPVHFSDLDPDEDRAAQNMLAEIGRAAGFSDISFQFEPVAAALDYESRINDEQLALIADIGGGTSDFSIIRLSPERARKHDRGADILANAGVHVGGTDFDRDLSLAQVMPQFGYGAKLKKAHLETPRHLFHDLATWHRIPFLYTQQVIKDVKLLRGDAQDPGLLDRFVTVLEQRYGHRLAFAVEETKIELTAHDAADIKLGFVEQGFHIATALAQLNRAIYAEVSKIGDTIRACVKQAGIERDDVQAVFLTGGSTFIPAVRREITGCVPEARLVEGDKFASIAQGLLLDARRKFS